MQRSIRKFRVLLPLVVLSAASFAFAGQSVYSSLPLPSPDTHANDIAVATPVENSFLAALNLYGTETYEEITGVRLGLTHKNQALTFGSSGITGTANFAGVQQAPGFTVSGLTALLEQPEALPTPNDDNNIVFNSLINGFGSYFIQAGDANNVDMLTLRLENTLIGSSKDVVIGTIGPNASSTNVFYFGVTDTDPFNKVTLLLSINTDGILLDNTTVGTVAVVPEPRADILLAFGAGVLLVFGRFVRRPQAVPR